MGLPSRVLILGCGFTGKRVAAELLRRGCRVDATTREPGSLRELADAGARIHALEALDRQSLVTVRVLAREVDAVVCSIPTLRVNGELVERVPALVEAMEGHPERAVYLSTTGIYGRQERIDEHTPPLPESTRERLRVEAENAVLSGFGRALVLRPAAIYGPGRGVHISLRAGRYRLTGDGGNFVSRIHVDDLAAHVLAALETGICGAFPVADEMACTQREMASYCARLLGLPVPPSTEVARAPETLRANRRVDGSGIRRALGITLRYPSYREGVPACLEAEKYGL